MTTLHDCVEESTPATSVMSANAHEVFDGELVQANEPVALGTRRVDVVIRDCGVVQNRDRGFARVQRWHCEFADL